MAGARARCAPVVLVGWSMGAAIIGALLDRSALAAAVAAWCGTRRWWTGGPRCASRPASAASRPGSPRSPRAVTRRRIGIDFDRFDLLARPPAVRPPTLVMHSTGDTAVPVAQPGLAAVAPELGWPIRLPRGARRRAHRRVERRPGGLRAGRHRLPDEVLR